MDWPALQNRYRLRNTSLALILLFSAGCASSSSGPLPDLASWNSERDCFRSDIAVHAGNAAAAAQACAGSEGAGDPGRRGTERAIAYFNAGAAYNILAGSDIAPVMCESKAACHQMALSMLEKSALSQEDFQFSAASERFVLRRAIEHAQAYYGLSHAIDFEASCGSPADCLQAGAEILNGHDLERLASSEQAVFSELGCRGLDLYWRINQARGSEHELETLQGLRVAVALCPAESVAATDALAGLSFRNAEQLHAAFEDRINLSPVPSDALALGMSAVSGYREAASGERYRLAALRAIGAIHLALADIQPVAARTHLVSAANAFGQALHLSGQGAPAEHASDLQALGLSQYRLSVIQGRTGDIEAETSLAAALRSLEAACGISAEYECYMTLGAAAEAAGRGTEAQAAYRAAIAAGIGTEREDGSLTLALFLEQSGQADEALSVLSEAIAGESDSPELNYAFGRLSFLKADHAGAMTALARTHGRLVGPQVAEAAYMQSVAETVLRRPGWQTRALTRADEAALANSNSGKYSRQSCLAHIRQGGKDVRAGTSLVRCPDDGSAEKSLLRGMYFLKQAQLQDVSAYDLSAQDQWRGALRRAEDAFLAGQAEIVLSGGDGSEVFFEDLGRTVDIAEHLNEGLDVVRRCRRELTIPEHSATWKKLEEFFGQYGVLRCSGT